MFILLTLKNTVHHPLILFHPNILPALVKPADQVHFVSVSGFVTPLIFSTLTGTEKFSVS
jgi:hypothetical protein